MGLGNTGTLLFFFPELFRCGFPCLCIPVTFCAEVFYAFRGLQVRGMGLRPGFNLSLSSGKEIPMLPLLVK